MKKPVFMALLAMLLVACSTPEQRMAKRFAELCRYIPDPTELEHSRGYLTEDFYAVLDTMFTLPDATPVLHEWEFWFVAADGSPVARCACDVLAVTQTDDSHATATVLVHPQDSDYFADEHVMDLELVNGEWLIADYDGNKANSRRYISIATKEQIK